MDVDTDSFYDFTATYFANIFWNELYNIAVDKWREEKFVDLKMAYTTIVKRYVEAFAYIPRTDEPRNRSYYTIISELWHYYRKYMPQLNSLAAFYAVYCQYILNETAQSDLEDDPEVAELVIRNFMSKVVTRMGVHMNQSVNTVIGVRSPEAAEKVREKFVELVEIERNELNSISLARSSGMDIRGADDTPLIPKKISDMLQQKLRELLQKNAELTQKYNDIVRNMSNVRQLLAEKDRTIKLLSDQLNSRGGGWQSRWRKPNPSDPFEREAATDAVVDTTIDESGDADGFNRTDIQSIEPDPFDNIVDDDIIADI